MAPRVLRLLSHVALWGTTATLPPALYFYRTVSDLEARYPPCRPEATSTPALSTPADPATQLTPYVDVYSARVPVRGLLSSPGPAPSESGTPGAGRGANTPESEYPASLEDAWARAFFESPALRATETREQTGD